MNTKEAKEIIESIERAQKIMEEIGKLEGQDVTGLTIVINSTETLPFLEMPSVVLKAILNHTFQTMDAFVRDKKQMLHDVIERSTKIEPDYVDRKGSVKNYIGR